jgi:hypothetical protein
LCTQYLYRLFWAWPYGSFHWFVHIVSHQELMEYSLIWACLHNLGLLPMFSKGHICNISRARASRVSSSFEHQNKIILVVKQIAAVKVQVTISQLYNMCQKLHTSFHINSYHNYHTYNNYNITFPYITPFIP